MTVGYPDWGRSVQTNTLPLVIINQNVKTSFTSAIEYVGDIGYIDVFASTTGLSDNYRITVTFYDDMAGATEAGTYRFTCVPGGQADIQYKSWGRYFNVTVENQGGTDTQAVSVYARGSNAQALHNSGQQTSAPLILLNQSVGAGGNVSAHGATIAPGPAVLAIQHGTNNSWTAELDYWDFTAAAWTEFLFIYGVDYGQSTVLPVILPAAQVQLILHNGDTSAHVMLGTVTA